MFDDIIRPTIRVSSRKAYVVPLSVGAHIVVVVAAILGAVMTPALLPVPVAALTAVLARDIVLPPPPAPNPGSTQRRASVNTDAAPVEAPSTIAPEPAVDLAPPAPIGTVEGAGNVAEALGQSLLPPPAAPVVKPESGVLRIGGNIKSPTKIKNVAPVYPAIAREAHVEGIVILETMIDTSGRVIDVKVLRSVPLLDDAALDAVRQWEFTPSLLNGTPVPVIMTVTVNFSLK